MLTPPIHSHIRQSNVSQAIIYSRANLISQNKTIQTKVVHLVTVSQVPLQSLRTVSRHHLFVTMNRSLAFKDVRCQNKKKNAHKSYSIIRQKKDRRKNNLKEPVAYKKNRNSNYHNPVELQNGKITISEGYLDGKRPFAFTREPSTWPDGKITEG